MLVGVFLLFFAAGIYIAAALGVLALITGYAFSDRPFWNFLGQMIWGPSSSFVLVAVPLFLLMGELLLRSGLSEQLYRALNMFLRRLPGGLLHTNIASCAVFSAIAGSSVATAATIGSVALPAFRNTGYDPKLVLGSLAAGGALGNLIPPGITFIIYGLITETSVGKLYVAAIGPSLLVVALFTVYIAVRGRRLAAHMATSPAPTSAERMRALVDLVPTLLLILLVLGSIYAGIATATESAALGVVGAMIFAALRRRLTLAMMHDAAMSTARTTSMIGLILFGAYLLNFILTSIGLPQTLAKFVGGLPFPPWAIMLLIVGFYLALGTFMEGFAMVITTVPIVFPIVKALGYDPIWFGVVVTMLVEIAMISPPDGTVLYVLQGMRRDGGTIGDVFAGVWPFVLLYIGAIGVLMALPSIALWLPAKLY
ncbi:MAG TPA: TRAP transporter large permease [Casimicrobiaceae bacterium]|nr:TRAP transporter large permease [Casimicrobiaceae bacterium]